MGLPQNLGPIVTAIGGLGTAAFGLLDALKSVLSPINLIGFPHIRDVVSGLTPNEAGAGSPANSLPQTNVLATLRANWVNGTDLVSQKAIAKSLVKLHLSVGNAAVIAAKTNVDSEMLLQVATSMATGTALTQVESDAYSRFDLIVTAMLDEAYQHSDQVYRNSTRALAGAVAGRGAPGDGQADRGQYGPVPGTEVLDRVVAAGDLLEILVQVRPGDVVIGAGGVDVEVEPEELAAGRCLLDRLGGCV